MSAAPSPTRGAARVTAKAVLAAAARLELTHRHLAATIGVSEASVSRLQPGRGIDPARKEGELALLVVRLYIRAGGRPPSTAVNRSRLVAIRRSVIVPSLALMDG